MNKKLYNTLIVIGIIVTLINGCGKENIISLSRIDLLTADSSKIWRLLKSVSHDSVTINPQSCLIDDEYKFQINGQCLIDNMGTIYSSYNSPIFIGPPYCKDTIDIIDHASWTLNTTMDTLSISTTKYVLIGRILKLTNDSLILKRTYSDTNFQIEYYLAK